MSGYCKQCGQEDMPVNGCDKPNCERAMIVGATQSAMNVPADQRRALFDTRLLLKPDQLVSDIRLLLRSEPMRDHKIDVRMVLSALKDQAAEIERLRGAACLLIDEIGMSIPDTYGDLNLENFWDAFGKLNAALSDPPAPQTEES